MTGLQSTRWVAAFALLALAQHAGAARELAPPPAAPHPGGRAATHAVTRHFTADDLVFLREAARLDLFAPEPREG